MSREGFVTLPNRTRSNSAVCIAEARKDSVRSCRCKMTLDVEGVGPLHALREIFAPTRHS